MSNKDEDQMTAEEFMAELRRDPEWREAQRERDRVVDKNAAELSRELEPLVRDLQALGFVRISDLDQLPDEYQSYEEALPVLMTYLQDSKLSDFNRGGLARLMATSGGGVYWDQLRDLYQNVDGFWIRQGIAQALASAATRENVDQLIALLEDRRDTAGCIFLSKIAQLGGAQGRKLIDHLSRDPLYGPEARAIQGRRKG